MQALSVHSLFSICLFVDMSVYLSVYHCMHRWMDEQWMDEGSIQGCVVGGLMEGSAVWMMGCPGGGRVSWPSGMWGCISHPIGMESGGRILEGAHLPSIE